MFGIDLSQHRLQSPHLPSCCGAGHVAPDVTTVDVWLQVPAAGWSIIGIENRIIKLSGHAVTWSLIHASRVGIQCLTEGDSLQTS